MPVTSVPKCHLGFCLKIIASHFILCISAIFYDSPIFLSSYIQSARKERLSTFKIYPESKHLSCCSSQLSHLTDIPASTLAHDSLFSNKHGNHGEILLKTLTCDSSAWKLQWLLVSYQVKALQYTFTMDGVVTMDFKALCDLSAFLTQLASSL